MFAAPRREPSHKGRGPSGQRQNHLPHAASFRSCPSRGTRIVVRRLESVLSNDGTSSARSPVAGPAEQAHVRRVECTRPAPALAVDVVELERNVGRAALLAAADSPKAANRLDAYLDTTGTTPATSLQKTDSRRA